MDNVNLKLIKECCGKVIYSHKTQEKAKELGYILSTVIKWANVFVVGMTVYFSYEAFLNPTKSIIGVVISSVFSLVFLVAQLSFNPQENARRHKETADKLWLVREMYQNLIADILTESIDEKIIQERRDNLTAQLDRIYADAPSTGRIAYMLASNALKVEKEASFTEKELNQLLPESLTRPK